MGPADGVVGEVWRVLTTVCGLGGDAADCREGGSDVGGEGTATSPQSTVSPFPAPSTPNKQNPFVNP